MRISERQARQRLAAAVAKAGSQSAFARAHLPHVRPMTAQSAVSLALVGRGRIRPVVLAALGLRRDEAGDIRIVDAALRPG